MNKKIFACFLSLFLLFLTSCLSMGAQFDPAEDNGDEGSELEELLPLEAYSRIDVKGPFNILLTNSTVIDSNMNKSVLQRLEFMVEDGVLYITPSRRFFPSPSDHLDIHLGITGIDEISIQVDGKVSTQGILRGEQLRLIMSGNVRGIINSDIESLYIESRSPGRIVLVGTAKKLETRVFSKGLLSLKNFRADELILNNEHGSQVLMPR